MRTFFKIVNYQLLIVNDFGRAEGAFFNC